MTYMSHAATSVEPLRAKSGWLIALGVLYIVAGLIALGSVVLATAASVFVVGIMMVVAGAGEVISAFQVRGWGNFFLLVLLGLLFVLAGLVTFQNPLLAAKVLTLILGVSLLVSGVMRIAVSFSMRHSAPWMWVALSGIVTFLLGLMILARWPVSSLYTLGIFLGVDLLFVGIGWVAAGAGLGGGTPMPNAFSPVGKR